MHGRTAIPIFLFYQAQSDTGIPTVRIQDYFDTILKSKDPDLAESFFSVFIGVADAIFSHTIRCKTSNQLVSWS